MSYLGKHRSYRRETGRARTRLLVIALTVAGVPTVLTSAIMFAGGSASDDSRPASTVGGDGAGVEQVSTAPSPTGTDEVVVSPTDTGVTGDTLTTPGTTSTRRTSQAAVTTTRAAVTQAPPPPPTKPRTTTKAVHTDEPAHTTAKDDPTPTKDDPSPGDTPTP